MPVLTTLALTAYATGKLCAWVSKVLAEMDARDADRDFSFQAQRYAVATSNLTELLVDFALKRKGILQTIYQDGVQKAQALTPREAFDSETGWFGAKSVDDTLKWIAEGDRLLDNQPEFLDEKSKWLFIGVLALQGFEYIEKIHVFPKTMLSESVRHSFQLPDAPTDHSTIADVVLDASWADVLAGPLLVWGLWRMADNISKAGQFGKTAEDFRRATRALSERNSELEAEAARVTAIRSEVDEAGYQAFRVLWIAQNDPRMGINAGRGRFLRDFEWAIRRFHLALAGPSHRAEEQNLVASGLPHLLTVTA